MSPVTRKLLHLAAAAWLLAGMPATVVADEAVVSVTFSDGEIRVIRAWFREHEGRAPGKGSKARGLPPGIARNLKRGKPLPPGIAKRALPAELRRSLPPVPQGYERLIVDGKVLLVEIATRVIHDVLTDVILR